MKYNLNKFYFDVLFFLIGISGFIILSLFDHGKYFLDGYKIIATEPLGWFFFSSYQSAATFFHPLFDFLIFLGVDLDSLNINKLSFYITMSFFLLITFFMLYHIKSNFEYTLTKLYFFSSMLFIVNYGIFFATVNKEIIYIFLMYILFLFFQYITFIKFLWLFFIFTVLYAFGGRYYFVIYALISIILYNFIHRKFLLLLIIIGFITIGFFLFPSIKFLLLAAKPYVIKDITNTWITDYFDRSEYFSFLLNTIVNTVRIMFPLELVLKGAKYIFTVVFLSLISYMSLKVVFLKKINLNETNKLEKLVYFSAIAIISFTIAQALFEPDFGSVLRHKINMMFFMFVLFAYFSTSSKKYYKGLKY